MNSQTDRPDVESADIDAVSEDPDTLETLDADSGEVSDEIEALKAIAEEYGDRYLRGAAAVETSRTRAVRDVENARKYALENFGRDLLAVVDSLEMGLEAADNADAESLKEGSEATLKLLATTLERFGVTVVDPEGEPFDPEFHEAMTMQPSADVEPDSVLTVIQKGYTLNGRLLRPARVIVASEPSDG